MEETTKVMPLKRLIELMMSGKPYIVPNEHFVFELGKVTIGQDFKINYKVIASSEDIPLDEKVEQTLHELFGEVEYLLSYWIRRGKDSKQKDFVDFTIVVQRQREDGTNPDQVKLPLDQNETKE
jgi:hypothetical protein